MLRLEVTFEGCAVLWKFLLVQTRKKVQEMYIALLNSCLKMAKVSLSCDVTLEIQKCWVQKNEQFWGILEVTEVRTRTF